MTSEFTACVVCRHVDVDVPDKFSCSALMNASQKGFRTLVKIILPAEVASQIGALHGL